MTARHLLPAALRSQDASLVRAVCLLASEVGRAEAMSAQGRDRSPESLALLLARTAERVRTAAEGNLAHCAVRGAARVLRARLDERLPVSTGGPRDATEGP